MNLTGNTILITGGGSGIGQALAHEFHQRGDTVIIAGRRQSALDATVAAHPGMHSIVLDTGDAASIAAGVAKLTADFPTLNAVINNAGIMQAEDVKSADTATAEATIATNLLGPIRLTAALLPHLLQQPRATVLTVSSGLAFVPMASNPTYCATKAAIHSYSQSLRYQLKNTNVRVVEIIPPWVATELQGAIPTDPRAMPLDAYIAETMQLLATDADEILVKNVLPLRNAEKGDQPAFFKALNDSLPH